eukprot:5986517-Pleurochrysis_carterae.AAC.1
MHAPMRAQSVCACAAYLYELDAVPPLLLGSARDSDETHGRAVRNLRTRAQPALARALAHAHKGSHADADALVLVGTRSVHALAHAQSHSLTGCPARASHAHTRALTCASRLKGPLSLESTGRVAKDEKIHRC